MYCSPGAPALGGICSLSTGKIYLLNFPLYCNKQLIISYIHPFSHPQFYFDHLLPSVFKVLSSWPPPLPSMFMLNQVQTRTMHCLAIPLVHVSVQLPLCGFYSAHPCLLSCLTCALKVCATGLPQGAQIPPLHPPFLYLHALKKILVVKLQVGLN